MQLQRRMLAAIATVITILVGGLSAAEPLLVPTDDGRAFLYRARPGDSPGSVATMFGIPPADLGAFMTANGIGDATRVGAGFVYRVPNPPAEALAERTAILEAELARLRATLVASEQRDEEIGRDLTQARATAAAAEARAARLRRLDTLWPFAQAAVVLLVLALGAAATFANAAARRQRQSERWSRALAEELEEKRRAALAERQDSARRILDLETRIRALEAQLGPRVLLGGRGS
jgi:hypothetical protein